MNGIPLESGVNNCYWNVNGRCTHYLITRNKPEFSRDWESKQNCTYTILGVVLCSCYQQQSVLFS